MLLIFVEVIAVPKMYNATMDIYEVLFFFQEGDMVNVDVTSPGATLALGMVFFNTGNRSVLNLPKSFGFPCG